MTIILSYYHIHHIIILSYSSYYHIINNEGQSNSHGACTLGINVGHQEQAKVKDKACLESQNTFKGEVESKSQNKNKSKK